MDRRLRSVSVPAPRNWLARPDLLRWHAALGGLAMIGAVLANLLRSPERLWAVWLALALGALLALHGVIVLTALLRPGGDSERPDAAGDAGAPLRPAPEWPAHVPASDPGPPIFPAGPDLGRPRRWIPGPPSGPAPEPRVAARALPATPAVARPAPIAEDVAIGAGPSVAAWPGRRLPADRTEPVGPSWPAPDLPPPGSPRPDREPASAGW